MDAGHGDLGLHQPVGGAVAHRVLEDHRIAHQILIGQVLAFDRDIREGQRDIRQDLIRFLLSWLETHILGEDKKLADFFNGLDTFYDVTDADGGNAEPRAEPGT